METNMLLIMVTVSSHEEAEKIANLLLTQRKAACVNILPPMDSLFWWQGKLESARENLLLIKTRISLFDDVARLVKSSHSYEVPEIIALPMVNGSQEYLDWIETETRA